MDNPSTILPVVAILVALASYRAYRATSASRPPAPLPPGPTPLPLIGNLAHLPRSHPWRTFSKWGDIYGGIVHVSALGQSIIILNDPKHAVYMLDKKSPLYSDRPTLVMAQLVGFDQSPVLVPYGDRWAEYRRLLGHFMGTKAKVDAFSHVIHAETNVFLKRILVEPHNWVEHTCRFARGTVLELAYGHRASDPGGTDLVRLVGDVMNAFSEVLKLNAFLVDVLPILRCVPTWFPGAAWKCKVKVYHDQLEELMRVPFELVKRQMAAGVARPSFMQSHLDGQCHSQEKEHIIQWAAMGIYAGGADTTVAGIECFFLGITRHTEEQRTAQAEIDAVVGHDRLPTLADREQLPYCEALYLEIMRNYTFIPVGLAHAVREDDVHDGYFIPKGSIIISNNWRFFRNPETYPNPEAFTPERFMGAEKQFDPRKYLFGYGRRICPGIRLADAEMWLACVSVLAAFDVVPIVKDGRPVIPSGTFLYDGAISHPEAFECVIKPRNATTEALVHGLSGNI